MYSSAQSDSAFVGLWCALSLGYRGPVDERSIGRSSAISAEVNQIFQSSLFSFFSPRFVAVFSSAVLPSVNIVSLPLSEQNGPGFLFTSSNTIASCEETVDGVVFRVPAKRDRENFVLGYTRRFDSPA